MTSRKNMIFSQKRKRITAPRWVLALAGLAVLTLMIAGPGSRLGLWGFRFGFELMRWAVYLAGVSAALAVLMLFSQRQRQTALGTLVSVIIIAAVTAYVPWSQLQVARSVPAIHDISTDLEDIPSFVDIAPLRAAAPNPVEHPGATVADQQREAYPDIMTFETPIGVDQVHQSSLEVISRLGWHLVASDATTGRIEASETTFWFGFVDDVVIRIRREDGLTQVDMRSKSRVRRSDVGKNAQRIRLFLTELKQSLRDQE